jgi:uncharacterized protein involved in exopolysaccharide biosynthesis
LNRYLEQLRARYQDEHPEVVRAKLDLEAAVRQEAKEAAAAQKRQTVQSATPAPKETLTPAEESRASVISPQLRMDLNRERERIAATRIQLELSKKEFETRMADRSRILALIAEYQGRLERLPVREQEMASITRDYENSKQNYRSLLDKKASALMAAAMERRQQSERFTLQDPARVPSKPIKPNRPVLIAVAALAGLILGVGVALALEFHKGQLLGEWELPAGITVLGRVPMISVKDTSKNRKGGNVSSRAAAALLIAVATVLTGVVAYV